MAAAPLAPGRTFQVQVAPDDLSDLKARVCYLGESKSGKTHNLASWNASSSIPNEPGVFAVVFGENIQTLLAATPRIPYVEIDNTEMLRREVIPWMLSGGLAKEYPSVESVGFDSGSFYSKLLNVETNGDWQMYANRAFGDWGQIIRLSMSTRKTGLPKAFNIIATCHERDRYSTAKTVGGQRERTLIGTEPDLAGQMSSHFPRYFDLLLYLAKRTTAVQVRQGQYEERDEFVCRAMQPKDHKAPAGGKIWGKTVTGQVEGTYTGLRRYCGFTENEDKATGAAQENSS